MNVTATRFSTQARTWVLIAGLSALLVAIGGRFLGGAGYLLFGGISVAFVFVSYWFSDRFAIRASHAQPISESDDPRLYAIVADLAQRAKVPMPRVYLIPSEQPNAFATGRNPKHAAMAVTEGLRRYLPEDQIRGVLAHEFAHIKNRDILVSSIAAMIAAAISAIANILQFGMIFGGGSDNRDNPLGMLGALATIIIAPIAAMILQLAVSRQREYLADATGAALIGDAKPLADALETLERGVAAIPMPVTPATAPCTSPTRCATPASAGLFQTHPPMEERIRACARCASRSRCYCHSGPDQVGSACRRARAQVPEGERRDRVDREELQGPRASWRGRRSSGSRS